MARSRSSNHLPRVLIAPERLQVRVRSRRMVGNPNRVNRHRDLNRRRLEHPSCQEVSRRGLTLSVSLIGAEILSQILLTDSMNRSHES